MQFFLYKHSEITAKLIEYTISFWWELLSLIAKS